MLGIGINIFKSGNNPSNPPTGGIAALSITNGGKYNGLATNDYVLTQGTEFTTSSGGTGAVITVTATLTVITAIVSIDTPGDGFSVGDTLTVTEINSISAFTEAILTVTAIT